MTVIELPPPPIPSPEEWETGVTGNYYTEQIRSIRRLRAGATCVAVIALLVLLVALGVTILSFTHQIDKATPAVNLKELVTSAKSVKDKDLGSGSSSKLNPAASLPQVPLVPTDPVSVSTAVRVDISSIGNSIVAVVSILVVAISVLAISLLRTTYTLSVDSVRGRDPVKPASVDTSLPIPGAELVKAIGEALATVLKGLPGKKD